VKYKVAETFEERVRGVVQCVGDAHQFSHEVDPNIVSDGHMVACVGLANVTLSPASNGALDMLSSGG
jgi:hypothetical protein